MREKIRYVNHLNEEVTTHNGIVFANENDLRDFEWKYTEKNNKITSFSKGVETKSIQFIICGKQEEAYEKRNEIYEIMEKDVLENKRGKLYVGDYYLECNMVKSKKSEYIKQKGVYILEITFATDSPRWIKEAVFEFTNASYLYDTEWLDFPYGYPYDYTSNKLSKKFFNDSIGPCDFELTIYGNCSNPYVYIGNNMYKVNVSLLTGELLKVNSKTKKIIKRDVSGAISNIFKNRDREHYIFEKVVNGSNLVILSGDFSITLKLFYERSEPKWT